jgi:energy-coupling factor transport system permease protein
MRSPLAYTARPGPLQAASPGAAVTYLGSLVVVAFIFLSPLVLGAVLGAAILAGLLAGARDAVRVGLRIGVAVGVPIVLVNALVVRSGETVLARFGEWPVLGQLDVTAEALLYGLILGLRVLSVVVVFSVYSACVDPDRVLRALRPLAARSALTATLVSRFVPIAVADAARLRDAATLRGPGATAVGRGALARRLLAGSLDRAVDVAATLELRGYSLQPKLQQRIRRSRYERRFYLSGLALICVAIAAKLLGAEAYRAYPTTQLGIGPQTVAVSVLILLSGLAPLRRAPRRAPPLELMAAPSSVRASGA